MNKIMIYIVMGLSAMVVALSILFNIGDSAYIDEYLLAPAAILFGAGMIALSISGNKSKK